MVSPIFWSVHERNKWARLMMKHGWRNQLIFHLLGPKFMTKHALRKGRPKGGWKNGEDNMFHDLTKAEVHLRVDVPLLGFLCVAANLGRTHPHGDTTAANFFEEAYAIAEKSPQTQFVHIPITNMDEHHSEFFHCACPDSEIVKRLNAVDINWDLVIDAVAKHGKLCERDSCLGPNALVKRFGAGSVQGQGTWGCLQPWAVHTSIYEQVLSGEIKPHKDNNKTVTIPMNQWKRGFMHRLPRSQHSAIKNFINIMHCLELLLLLIKQPVAVRENVCGEAFNGREAQRHEILLLLLRGNVPNIFIVALEISWLRIVIITLSRGGV